MFKQEENLQYNKVSRVHFSISRNNGNLILKNNSMNGTFVNGILVDKIGLLPGDVVSVLQNDFEIFRFEC
jgi:pSer/pThr/pTyr-binding forkhead associated (FHA) protein